MTSAYRFRTVFRVIVLLLLLMTVAPVWGQDVTPTPAPVTAPEASGVSEWVYVVGALLLAIAGGGSFALVFTRLDARAKQHLEQAYMSLPPQWQTAISNTLSLANEANRVLTEANKALTEALKIANELTDGKPNDGGA
jgi:type II secretory pathway component PulF